MIPLKRPTKVPDTLKSKGKAAASAVLNMVGRKVKKLTFRSDIYGADDVRKSLRTMHHKKCAFCESPLPQSTAGHVEHFRPKGEVQQKEKGRILKPGYYWLAYEWSNLFLACEWCNSRAKRKLFPLVNPSKRARSPKDRLEDEHPLLVDPSVDDPSDHIEFLHEEVRPKGGSLKGEESIRVFRLDDPELTEFRRDKLGLFRALRDLARLARPMPEAKDAISQVQKWERRIASGEIEYAAMLRANL